MIRINKNGIMNTNKKLAFQIQQKESRVAKLVIDNKKLLDQNNENEKGITELKIANEELMLLYKTNKICQEELAIVNKELLSQNKINKNQELVLLKTNEKLKNAQESLKGYIKGLESILYKTSHRIRQPITNILGLSYLLDDSKNSNEELKIFVEFIKESALTLDDYTQELSSYTSDLKKSTININ